MLKLTNLLDGLRYYSYFFLTLLFSYFFGFFFIGTEIEVVLHFEQHKSFPPKEVFLFCVLLGPIVATSFIGFYLEKRKPVYLNKKRLFVFWLLNVIGGYSLGTLATFFLIKTQLAYCGKLIDKLIVIILTPFIFFLAFDLFSSLFKNYERKQIFFLLALFVVFFFYYYVGIMRWMENTNIGKLNLKEIISLSNIPGFLFSSCTFLLWLFLSRFAGKKEDKNET